MLPVMLIVLALSFMRTSTILFFVTILTYTVLLVAVADTFFMYRSLKKKIAAKFGDEAAAAKGNGMYAAMRAFRCAGRGCRGRSSSGASTPPDPSGVPTVTAEGRLSGQAGPRGSSARRPSARRAAG